MCKPRYNLKGKQEGLDRGLPFDVFFSDFWPAFFANGQAFAFVVNVDFYVRVLAFLVPRILAAFNCFTYGCHCKLNCSEFTFKVPDLKKAY
jgi:hypothetical protein